MSAPIPLRTASPPLISALSHYDEVLQHWLLLLSLLLHLHRFLLVLRSHFMFVCVRVKCFTDIVISSLLWNVSLNKVARIPPSLAVCFLFCLSQPQVIASIFTGCLILLFFIPHHLIFGALSLPRECQRYCTSLPPIRRALLSLRNTICSHISI